MTLNCIWWWGSGPVALQNVEYPLIAITLRSYLHKLNGQRPKDLSAQGAVLPGSNLLRGAKFIAWHPRRSSLGDADGVRGIFEANGSVKATALRPNTPKKGLVPHSYGRWDERQIPTFRLRQLVGEEGYLYLL